MKKNTIRNKKKYNYTKTKSLNLTIINKTSLNSYIVFFYLPIKWNFLLISKQSKENQLCFYIYSFTYFFFLPVPSKFLSLKYDTQTHSLILKFFYKNNFNNIFWFLFKTVFSSFSKIFFRKLKFRGKGYYIYKNSRNTIALQFGYSHLLYLYSYFVNVRFLTKTSILVFGINKINIWRKSYDLFHIKPINIFTGKGIRFSRQIIYKKTGKISSYR